MLSYWLEDWESQSESHSQLDVSDEKSSCSAISSKNKSYVSFY